MNVHTTIDGNVMRVRLDCAQRPVNTITPAVMDELEAVVAQLERGEPAVEGVIFCSAKQADFLSGADLFAMRDMNDEEAGAFIERGQALLDRISKLPMTTVAAINGTCLGGGTELALACTHRVAADDGSITIGLPEVKLGILPGWGGTTRLPRVIGFTKALPLLLTGRTLAPRKAMSAGIIDEVVKPETLERAATRLARTPPKRRKLAAVDRAIMRVNPMREQAMKRARRQTLANTHGNYPAAEAILDVVEIGLRDGVEAGLKAEREALARLVQTDACRNLMRLFFLRQESKRAVRAKLDAKPRPVRQAAVIGGGVMGSGIVHALIRAGVNVRLIEIDAAQMSKALQRIRKELNNDVRSKRLSPVEARRAMHRVSPSLTFTGLSKIDLAVEAVVERPSVKRDVFELLDDVMPADAVLASNTSSLDLGELSRASKHPARVIGLHFFNPVPKMPLVEVVRTDRSEAAALATGVQLGQQIGKTVVLVNDGPGFLVNRLLIPYLAEAIAMAAEGADIAEVDGIMKRWGMPMGPFELLDQVGLDVSADIFRSLGPRLGDHLPRVEKFETVTDHGWLGKKNGVGFYRYDHRWWQWQSGPMVNTKLLRWIGAERSPQPLDEPAVVERLMLPMVNEAARVLAEGVTDSSELIDLSTVLGLGWAPFRGGLIRWAEGEGLTNRVNAMDRLVGQHGARFTPTDELRAVAAAGEPMQAIVEHRPGGTAGRGEAVEPHVDRITYPIRND